MKPGCQLNFARVGNYAGHSSSIWRSNIMIWNSKICMVQHIECLSTKLHSKPAGNSKILVHSEIPSLQARTDENIPTRISKGIKGWVRKTGQIEPMVNTLLRSRQVAIADAIGPLECTRICG